MNKFREKCEKPLFLAEMVNFAKFLEKILLFSLFFPKIGLEHFCCLSKSQLTAMFQKQARKLWSDAMLSIATLSISGPKIRNQTFQ